MRALLIAAGLTFANFAVLSAAQAACPEGYKASEDNYGNEVCQYINPTPAASVQKPGACPQGTYPVVDDGGRNVCKFPEPGTALDAKGCPAGMAMSVDAAGQQACKKS